MSRQLQAAVGLGALGLAGLTYICYKKITSGSTGNILRDSVNDHTESDSQDKDQMARDSDSKDSVNDHTESDTQDKDQTAWNSDSKDIDIYLVYSEADRDKVQTFKQNIERYVKTQDVTVVLMEDVAPNKTLFDAYLEGWNCSIFTFLFVTEAFNNDNIKLLMADIGLRLNCESPKQLLRLVPVWAEPGIENSAKCPPQLAVFQGSHYDQLLEGEKQMIFFEKIDQLLMEGRGEKNHGEIKITKKQLNTGGQSSTSTAREKESESKSPDVFLSYQWGKQSQIKQLYKRLSELGLTCWMDIEQMVGGDIHNDKIDRAIRDCKIVICCVTNKYASSSYCQREVSLADSLKKPVVPLLLEKMDWPPSGPMSMVFTQLLYINFYRDEEVQMTWTGNQFDKLLAKIKKHVPDTIGYYEDKKKKEGNETQGKKAEPRAAE